MDKQPQNKFARVMVLGICFMMTYKIFQCTKIRKNLIFGTKLKKFRIFAKTNSSAMKKKLNISLLIFAITLVTIGCRKEQDASLVNTWRIERLEIREIKFAADVNMLAQVAANVVITTTLDSMVNPRIAGSTFEFLDNGKVLITSADGNFYFSDSETYTISGKTLTITAEGAPNVVGTYAISKDRMTWDVNSADILFHENAGLLEELGVPSFIFHDVTSFVFRFVFRVK